MDGSLGPTTVAQGHASDPDIALSRAYWAINKLRAARCLPPLSIGDFLSFDPRTMNGTLEVTALGIKHVVDGPRVTMTWPDNGRPPSKSLTGLAPRGRSGLEHVEVVGA